MLTFPLTVKLDRYLIEWTVRTETNGQQLLAFRCLERFDSQLGYKQLPGIPAFVTLMSPNTTSTVIAAATTRIVEIISAGVEVFDQLELLSYMTESTFKHDVHPLLQGI